MQIVVVRTTSFFFSFIERDAQVIFIFDFFFLVVTCTRSKMSANFRKQSINSDLWTDDAIPLDTPMRNFYRGKVVFLTGGTGFLGQIYVEKLLR